MDKEEALAKMYRFCTYQERCHKEVTDRLHGMELATAVYDEVIHELLELNLYSDQRYANAYAQGRFRIKKWGRIKIKHYLLQKGVASQTIDNSLATLIDEEYEDTLRILLASKLKTVKAANPYEQNDKAARYAIGKGYEPGLVWEVLKEVSP